MFKSKMLELKELQLVIFGNPPVSSSTRLMPYSECAKIVHGELRNKNLTLYPKLTRGLTLTDQSLIGALFV